MIDAVCDYLDFFNSPPNDMPERLSALAQRLDQLAIAYLTTVEPDDKEYYFEHPTSDWHVIHEHLGELFPTLGSYAQVPPIDDLDQKPQAAFAIIDLTAIYTDMLDVVWYYEVEGIDEATRHFRFCYQDNFGRHLHNVRRYLASSTVTAW